MNEIITNSLAEAHSILNEFMENELSVKMIGKAAKTMCDSIENGGKILACGNGGSLCDATHFAEELTARFRNNRRSIPAIAINDPAFITCAANDFNPDYVFARYVEGLGSKRDTLLAISTSGNSKNVVAAAVSAKKIGMKVVALTGKNGGKLAKISDVEIRSPSTKFSDRTQEIHIKVIHILVECIENQIIYGKKSGEI